MKEKLVLGRLIATGANGATEAQVRKDLEPIFARAGSPRDAARTVAGAVEELRKGGFLEAAQDKRSVKYRLTARGRRSAQELFPGINEKTTFATLKKTWLIAHALGMAPGMASAEVRELAKSAVLCRVLINRHFKLGLPAIPDAKQFDAALAWHAMHTGLSDAAYQWARQRALNLPVVLSALAASLGEVIPGLKKAEVYTRVAAKIAGAHSAQDLHAAVLARLAAARAPTTRRANAERRPDGFRKFARNVIAAARRSPTGKLDDSLVLINHAYSRYVDDNPADGLSLAEFKNRLWAAAQAGELRLASADMPQTLDGEDYAASRIERGASVFALIRI